MKARLLYTLRLWAATVLAGVLAGIAALYAVALSDTLIYLLYGGTHGAKRDTMQAVAPLKLVLVLTLSGLLAGICWRLLLRRPVVSLANSLKDPQARYSLRRTFADATLQIALVSVGTSVGREKAPREMAAALANRVTAPFKLEPQDRALVLASAAGAGLAAVYNTPAAGAAYTLCTVLTLRRWLDIPLALATSFTATGIAHILVPLRAFYRFEAPPLSPWLLALALILSLTCGVLGYTFHRAGALAQSGLLPKRLYPLTLTIALLATGLLGHIYPDVLGNGAIMVQSLLLSPPALLPLLTLTLLKPLLTFATLGADARGGVLAPALAFGAGIGALLATGISDSSQATVLALLGAGTLLAASEKSGIFAGIFTAELVHASLELTLLLLTMSLISASISRTLGRRHGMMSATSP